MPPPDPFHGMPNLAAMKTAELPLAMTTTAAIRPGIYSQTVRRVVERFTYPAEKPFITLVLYYILLFGVGALVLTFVPGSADMVSGKRMRAAPNVIGARIH